MVDFQSRESRQPVGTDDSGDTDDPEQDTETDADTDTDTQTEPADGTDEVDETDGETALGPDTDAPGQTEEPTEATAEDGRLGVGLVRVGTGEADTARGVDAVRSGLDGTATVATSDRIRAEYDTVQSAVARYASRADTDFVVTVGGTGIEPSDVTVEALEPLFEKRLPGFGELFRLFGHERVGTGVIGTRATAGVVEETPVFVVPGDPDAAGVAVEKLIRPEVESLVAAAAGRD